MTGFASTFRIFFVAAIVRKPEEDFFSSVQCVRCEGLADLPTCHMSAFPCHDAHFRLGARPSDGQETGPRHANHAWSASYRGATSPETCVIASATMPRPEGACTGIRPRRQVGPLAHQGNGAAVEKDPGTYPVAGKTI